MQRIRSNALCLWRGKHVSVNAASAIVEALGMKKTVTTRLLGELQPGDFVTVHADIAYGRISREEYDTAKVLWKKLAKCS